MAYSSAESLKKKTLAGWLCQLFLFINSITSNGSASVVSKKNKLHSKELIFLLTVGNCQ